MYKNLLIDLNKKSSSKLNFKECMFVVARRIEFECRKYFIFFEVGDVMARLDVPGNEYVRDKLLVL